jgi:hypothetical protein
MKSLLIAVLGIFFIINVSQSQDFSANSLQDVKRNLAYCSAVMMFRASQIKNGTYTFPSPQEADEMFNQHILLSQESLKLANKLGGDKMDKIGEKNYKQLIAEHIKLKESGMSGLEANKLTDTKINAAAEKCATYRHNKKAMKILESIVIEK